MKSLPFLLALLYPFVLFAQNNKGIHFETGATWQEIRKKAKLENKYVFIDCYTTWCAPCKYMDNYVYSNEEIGKITNDRFIAVRMQMDTTANDNLNTKAWYKDVSMAKEQYSVNTFPTFVFLSPDGKIVHKEIGAKTKEQFEELLTVALDSNRQFYVLLEKYKNGARDYLTMPYLIKMARSYEDKELAELIGRDYIDNYLMHASYQDLMTKENIRLLSSFVTTTQNKIFDFFYQNSSRAIDSIIGEKFYAQRVADYAITKEFISPKLVLATKNGSKPQWRKMYKAIKTKFDKSWATRNLIEAKIRWYGYNNIWRLNAKYNIAKIEKYGLDTSAMGRGFVNNMIWEVFFEHSNNKKRLKKASRWMVELIKSDPLEPVFLDTYANLLYKSGRKNEAIQQENKAALLEQNRASKNNSTANKVYIETLEKMKRGEKTWPESTTKNK
jgi:thiol-disulfide isomerase/thioredoxin